MSSTNAARVLLPAAATTIGAAFFTLLQPKSDTYAPEQASRKNTHPFAPSQHSLSHLITSPEDLIFRIADEIKRETPPKTNA